MKLLARIFLTVATLQSIASADSSKIQDCTRLWQLEKEAGCPAAPVDQGLYPAPWKRDYWFVDKDFGPSKCVTDDNVDHETSLLEDRCNKWVKERQNELRGKFLTSSCNQDCKPCPKNEVLQKCTIKGEVHYKVTSSDPAM